MEEKMFYATNVGLNFIENGTADTSILLLHGGSSRWQSFEPIIEELAETVHVYAIDLRGHGKSDRVKNEYRLNDYVPEIKEFIENEIGNPTIIVGHSLGGMIGLLIAAYYPEIVQGLVIGDSPIALDVLREHTESQKEMTMLWRKWSQELTLEEIINELKKMKLPTNRGKLVTAAEAYGENHPWFSFMATNLKQNDPDMLTAIIDNFDETYGAYNIEKLVPKITCPTLIIKGDSSEGSLIRQKDISKVQSLNKSIESVEIKGVGHALYMQDKVSFLNALGSFIRKVEKETRSF
jgi:pimeloyl-ACP methyl ester carboxylesterase